MTIWRTQVHTGAADSSIKPEQESAVTTRIKGPEGGAVDGAGRSRAINRVQPTAPATAAGSSSDHVESVHITSAAHQLLALQQQIAETPDVDVARVEQLRADLNQNRYQIDAGRIADSLLQLESDLQASAGKTADP
jgi:flagellar biosynthesis anti-sigma factor FlgM